jgi:MFS superfamily sulfate permease-like transporter
LLATARALWPRLLPLGISVFLLSHVQDVSAARELATRRREGVSPRDELLASGATNLAAGAMGGMPVAGAGLPPSLANEEGARAPLALAVSGVLILLVVLLPAQLRYVPDAMLSANLIRHAFTLIDVGALVRLYRGARREFTTAAITSLGVLLLGPLSGVFIGVVVTLCDASERVNHRIAAMLRAALRRRSLSVREDGAVDHPSPQPVGVMIIPIDSSVLFLNAESLRGKLVARLDEELERRPVHLLVLDLERSWMMDVSGAEMIHELQDALARRGIAVRIAGARAPVVRFLAGAGPARFPMPGRSAARVIRDWRRSPPER